MLGGMIKWGLPYQGRLDADFGGEEATYATYYWKREENV